MSHTDSGDVAAAGRVARKRCMRWRIQLSPRGGEPWRGARTADNVAARSPGPLPVPARGGGGGCIGAIAWTRVVRFQSAAITNWGLNYKRS